jgi:hypothetical protein
MSSSKFAQYANRTVVFAVAASFVGAEQHDHIHQHGPVWPGRGYGAQAVVTSTDTSTSSLGGGVLGG